MKLLVTGANGQLGRSLQAALPAAVVPLTRADLDLADPTAITELIAHHRPTHLVNAAAYTAVDKAESEPDAAERINAVAPRLLARAAADAGIGLTHVSTDFVFDGQDGQPYGPDSPTSPLGTYGATKLRGEQAVRANHPAPLIVRTAWVYAAQGANFVQTMLRLMRERPEVRVVADQIGTPTHAAGLANALIRLMEQGATGTFHWTDAGAASWYDFAVAIQEEALAAGLLERRVPVVPIRTIDFPTPARRPGYSVLDKTATWAITGPAAHWREELRACIRHMATPN